MGDILFVIIGIILNLILPPLAVFLYGFCLLVFISSLFIFLFYRRTFQSVVQFCATFYTEYTTLDLRMDSRNSACIFNPVWTLSVCSAFYILFLGWEKSRKLVHAFRESQLTSVTDGSFLCVIFQTCLVVFSTSLFN